MLMPMLMASPDKSTFAPHFNHLYLRNSMRPMFDVTGIMWCWCHWHHMIKNHGSPHFYHLDLRNSLTPFRISSLSHSNNDITWWKETCCTLFLLSGCKEFIGAIYAAIGVIDTNVSSITWPKRHLHLISIIGLRNAMVPVKMPMLTPVMSYDQKWCCYQYP